MKFLQRIYMNKDKFDETVLRGLCGRKTGK